MLTRQSLNKGIFLKRVHPTEKCWFWEGSINAYGYGTLIVDRKSVGAHRVSYELFKGPIPLNLQIDHLCCVKNCVNPDHLEAVTINENSRRMQQKRGRPTHCARGHLFDLSSTMIKPNGRRRCRICFNEYARIYNNNHRKIN